MEVKDKKVSTSALAKSMSMTGKELFSKMEGAGWIVRQEEAWQLTEKGKAKGGEYTNHPKYGTYIVWPELVGAFDEGESKPDTKAVLSSSALGKKNDLTAQKMNALFSELGWVKKALKGWNLTPQGEAMGGVQREDIVLVYPMSAGQKSS
ncbi:MAG: hypothetical protein ACR2PT_19015 [Endozoicomonas sp.]